MAPPRWPRHSTTRRRHGQPPPPSHQPPLRRPRAGRAWALSTTRSEVHYPTSTPASHVSYAVLIPLCMPGIVPSTAAALPQSSALLQGHLQISPPLPTAPPPHAASAQTSQTMANEWMWMLQLESIPVPCFDGDFDGCNPRARAEAGYVPPRTAVTPACFAVGDECTTITEQSRASYRSLTLPRHAAT